MKIASSVARYLLGFIFLVFGLNGFLHFIPMPLPPGLAGQFLGALFLSHYLVVVLLLELIAGVLLLVNRFVPLSLVILGPVIVNILLFHSFMAPSGLPLALAVAVLWVLTAAGVHVAFHGIFRHRIQA